MISSLAPTPDCRTFYVIICQTYQLLAMPCLGPCRTYTHKDSAPMCMSGYLTLPFSAGTMSKAIAVRNALSSGVKRFARLPALPLINLPAAECVPFTYKVPSSPIRGKGAGVDLQEGCFITKSIKYTHQLAHWTNPFRNQKRDREIAVRKPFLGP
jgi:hypothetical protein